MANSKKNDALALAHDVEFNGESYSVPTAEEWDIAVLEAVEEGKMIAAVKALIGEDQYAKFRAGNRTARSLGEFFEALGEGANAGN